MAALMVALAGGTWVATAALSGAARWLVSPRSIDECDLMLVPGGGARERLFTARELLEDGACGAVFVTGEMQEGSAVEARKVLHLMDVPILVEPWRETHSTFGDAVAALELARRKGFRSILVITSPFHTRRLSWVFDRVFQGTGIGFGVHPSDSFYMNYERWWANRHGRGVVGREYLKLWASGAIAAGVVNAAALAALLPSGG